MEYDWYGVIEYQYNKFLPIGSMIDLQSKNARIYSGKVAFFLVAMTTVFNSV
jgi:hypothetical protein